MWDVRDRLCSSLGAWQAKAREMRPQNLNSLFTASSRVFKHFDLDTWRTTQHQQKIANSYIYIYHVLSHSAIVLISCFISFCHHLPLVTFPPKFGWPIEIVMLSEKNLPQASLKELLVASGSKLPGSKHELVMLKHKVWDTFPYGVTDANNLNNLQSGKLQQLLVGRGRTFKLYGFSSCGGGHPPCSERFMELR